MFNSIALSIGDQESTKLPWLIFKTINVNFKSKLEALNSFTIFLYEKYLETLKDYEKTYTSKCCKTSWANSKELVNCPVCSNNFTQNQVFDFDVADWFLFIDNLVAQDMTSIFSNCLENNEAGWNPSDFYFQNDSLQTVVIPKAECVLTVVLMNLKPEIFSEKDLSTYKEDESAKIFLEELDVDDEKISILVTKTFKNTAAVSIEDGKIIYHRTNLGDEIWYRNEKIFKIETYDGKTFNY